VRVKSSRRACVGHAFLREKQMAEGSIKKFKRRVIFAALGLALAAAVGWFAALRDIRQPERVTPREGPTISVPSTQGVPVSRHPASMRTTEFPSNAASETTLPVRRASDSGRAQPVFIGLMAPQSARVGEPFRVDVTGESENDFARVALAIRFDPRVIRVAGAQQGDLMVQGRATAAFSYAVDAQTGQVSIELNENEGGNPVSGGGTLCSVEFVAIAPGRAPLAIDHVVVEDLNNEAVSYSLLPPPTLAVRE
jgi:hypothetical protein